MAEPETIRPIVLTARFIRSAGIYPQTTYLKPYEVNALPQVGDSILVRVSDQPQMWRVKERTFAYEDDLIHVTIYCEEQWNA